MDVRPIDPDELDAVCAAMPWRWRRQHAGRLALQRADEGMYLIAWVDDAPLGHVLVKWTGGRAGHPEIEDLFVAESHRNAGIGKALLGAAEEEARRRGLEQVGLAVGLDEGYDAAHHIYDARGYEDAGLETFWLIWTATDDDGVERDGRELCVYRVKAL